MKKSRMIGIVILIVVTIWLLWGNKALEQTFYTISSEKLPAQFDGFRIVHISDLHNTEFGRDNKKLLTMIADAKPDMIALTGDLIDSRRTNLQVALEFAKAAMEIAPCYYVPGNHESRSDLYPALQLRLQEMGVIVLEDDRLALELQGEKIEVVGALDPSFSAAVLKDGKTAENGEKLNQLLGDADYAILLSHRPELFDSYVQSGVDLVLTGHAHGGQMRLPILGGVLVPNQGWFAEYDEGLHVQNSTHMIISRGLGNSLFPLRINNRPEVITIELNCISN